MRTPCDLLRRDGSDKHHGQQKHQGCACEGRVIGMYKFSRDGIGCAHLAAAGEQEQCENQYLRSESHPAISSIFRARLNRPDSEPASDKTESDDQYPFVGQILLEPAFEHARGDSSVTLGAQLLV